MNNVKLITQNGEYYRMDSRVGNKKLPGCYVLSAQLADEKEWLDIYSDLGVLFYNECNCRNGQTEKEILELMVPLLAKLHFCLPNGVPLPQNYFDIKKIYILSKKKYIIRLTGVEELSALL